MNVVFISNYFNHHQRPLSDAFTRLTNGCFRFIATSEMRQERRELGYGNWDIPSYVLDMTDGDQAGRCLEAIEKSDIIIAGSCPRGLFRKCVSYGKPVFNYSERLRKTDGFSDNLRLTAAILRRIPKSRHIYLLAAGAYTYGDYARLGYFKDRAYKWGYFPEARSYFGIDRMLAEKQPRSILWAGRLIGYKRAGDLIKAAAILSSRGYDFRLDMIGSGVKEEEIGKMITDNSLEDKVVMKGSMPPEEVRSHMEKSEIFAICADKEEGWGAVLNEAMNSACAVVTSDAPGSTPYLVKNGENGLIYRSGDVNALADDIASLLDDSPKREALGKAAYGTINDSWNADVAAERLLVLAGRILSGDASPDLFDEGPCSKAEIMRY